MDAIRPNNNIPLEAFTTITMHRDAMRRKIDLGHTVTGQNLVLLRKALEEYCDQFMACRSK